MTARRTAAKIYRGTARSLRFLARCLRAGELVAVPTETVYGLAADALNARASAKIFRAKGRPTHDPLIVHIHSFAQLELLAKTNDAAKRLAKKFWPGALTLVLPKKKRVPAIVTAGLPSVAVRMPRHPLMRRLLRLCDRPLAAPSANPFGYVSPTTAEHVRAGLGKKIRFILDGGPAAVGLESTIVDLRDPRHPRLLRPGAISRRQIEDVLGIKLRSVPTRGGAKHAPLPAPGLLDRHYSPRTPLVLHKKMSRTRAAKSGLAEAWLFFARPAGLTGPNVFWLDARGDAYRAARRLFSRLRALDGRGFEKIHAEAAPAGDLAEAINDRLRRAAGLGQA
ncbi:MAG TPA: L-threonylcarbamoyladenylate synthase [Opitutaceae bacterium]|nr:L-threonylcarbamoyladenylate synthase [Opitutaceae bacterium]